MNDPSFYENREETTPVGPGQPPGTIPGPYKFSPDELKVLGECNRESFFQRSLPLGTALGFSTYVAIQKGTFKANARFGAIPKVTLAVMLGYFIGKLSYQEACAEKLMALPGSYIGQLLRERKYAKVKGTGMQKAPTTMFGAEPNDIYSDAGPGSSLDLNTDRPLFDNDSYQPGSAESESSSASPAPGVPPSRPLTYEELRLKNRGEYQNSKQEPYRLDPNTVPPPPTRPSEPSPARKPRNKYGDVID